MEFFWTELLRGKRKRESVCVCVSMPLLAISKVPWILSMCAKVCVPNVCHFVNVSYENSI